MTAIGCRSMSVTVVCGSTRGTVPTGPIAILALSRKRHGYESRSSLMPRLFIYRPDGAADFDALHSRTVDDKAVALAFDLLHSGDDIRRQPLIERKNTLKWVLRKSRGGIQYVDHIEGDGEKMFKSRLQARP